MIFRYTRPKGGVAMNTLQIECFLSVAKSHSFSGAARERYISQPTISKHIRNLEEELGVILFHREYMCTSLTHAGELYFALFTDFIENLQQAKLKTQQYTDQTMGTIRLGLLYGWNIPEPLVRGFDHFNSRFPNVSISVENHGFKDLITYLNNGMLDACIHLQDFLDLIDNLHTTTLLSTPKYLIYSPRMVVAAKTDLAPIDFQHSTYYCIAEQTRSPIVTRMTQYCAHYGFAPNIAFKPNIESVLSNVSLGNGVTILDGFTKLGNHPDLHRLSLNPPHRASIAWPKSTSNELLPLLAEELKAYFRTADCS